MNNCINLNELNKYDDNDIIKDLLNENESSLIIESVFSKDIKKLNNLYDRLNKIEKLDTYKYMSFIISKIIETLNDENTQNTDINECKDNLYIKFPIETFNNEIRNLILSISESLQVPVDMVAVSVLGIFSVTLQRNFKVKIKNDWFEPLNLYCVIIAEPSEKKSPVISLLSKPILELQKEKNLKLKPEILRTSFYKEKLLNEKDKLIRKQGKEVELENIIKELSSLKTINEITYFSDDITSEKLASLMADNDNCMSIISTEGGIFDMMLGKYSNKPNFDIFLKAYSNDNIKVDRMNGTSITLENPKLSILLAIQPNLLNNTISNELLRTKGLISRFLFAYPKSIVGSRKFETPAIDKNLMNNYNNLIKQLLNMDYKPEKILNFSNQAQKELEIFFYEIENNITTKYSCISDWCGKLLGNTSRIATILALIKNPNTNIVSVEDISNAIKISKYFLQNILNILKDSSASKEVKEAKYILEYITEKHLFFFKIREIVRGRGKYNNNDDAQIGLRELLKRKYIFKAEDNDTYFVNPKLYDDLEI